MNRKLWALPICAALLLPFPSRVVLAAEYGTKSTTAPYFNLVGTDQVQMSVFGENDKEEGASRVSFAIGATREQLASGTVDVGGVNLFFPDVDQRLLSGVDPEGAARSTAGFATAPGQTLLFDDKAGVFRGELVGNLYYAQLAELLAGTRVKGDCYSSAPMQEATLAIEIRLASTFKFAEGEDRLVHADADVSYRLGPAMVKAAESAPFDIRSAVSKIPVEWSTMPPVEIQRFRSLCLQPIRFLQRLNLDWRGRAFSIVRKSGLGLEFGLPAAHREWAKADLSFDVRNWVDIENNDYWVVDQDEYSRLSQVLSPARNPACIDVVFLHSFPGLPGGGVTAYSGSQDSVVLTTDDVVEAGVDLHHLAHELGHVVGLSHPGDSVDELYPASAGTVMCPSGFASDNPSVNSQENADYLSNPLLTYELRLSGAQSDCEGYYGDCGACP